MPADAESYFGGAYVIGLTPYLSFSSRITASRNARIFGSLFDLNSKLKVSESVQRLDLLAFALSRHAPDRSCLGLTLTTNTTK